MNSKKTMRLSIAAIALLLINASLVYLYFFNHKISARSYSENYSIIYHPTKEFTQLIDRWDIFKKRITVNGTQAYANQMIIELAEKPQPTTNPKPTEIIANSGIEYSKGILTIRIYVSKHPSLSTETLLNSIVIQQLVGRLYAVSHGSLTVQEANDELLPVTKTFINNPQQNPLKVTRKE